MTPGPWIVTAGGVLRDAATKTEIAVFDTTREPWLENANVCAAAPDLLDALRKLADMTHWRCRCSTAEIDSGHHVDCWKPEAEEAADQARAAIAKAHGGSR